MYREIPESWVGLTAGGGSRLNVVKDVCMGVKSGDFVNVCVDYN